MSKPGRIAIVVGVVLVGVALVAVLWLRADDGSSSDSGAAPPSTAGPTSRTEAPTTARATTTVTSSRPASDCVAVRKIDETVVGCVFTADTHDLKPPTPTRPGAPVYDHAGGAVVGYVTANAGFVPISLVPQMARVVECNRVAINLGPKAVEASCRPLLIAQGYPASSFPSS